MARRADDVDEIPIDRQGRLVVPRQLRAAFGTVPTTVRARLVEGGVLLESPPVGAVGLAEDGLPVLNAPGVVTNEKVLAGVDAERADR